MTAGGDDDVDPRSGHQDDRLGEEGEAGRGRWPPCSGDDLHHPPRDCDTGEDDGDLEREPDQEGAIGEEQRGLAVSEPLRVLLDGEARESDDGKGRGGMAATALLQREAGEPERRQHESQLRRVPEVVVNVAERLTGEPVRGGVAQEDAYRGGKEGLLGFFVGQVMKETKGQADPRAVNDLVRAKLAG